jgi:hypothetical protein
MAVPTEATDRTIYVVDISMGSPFRCTGRDIDDMTREIKYKWGKEKRNRIGTARQSVNVAVAGTCMKFFKTRITNEAGKNGLIQACTAADREMKQIDPALHVTPIFFEVKVSSLSAGNMFDQMKEQLSVQVHERVLDRIKKVLEQNKNADGTYKPLTGKTRTALLTMLDKIKEINVLDDQNVEARINAMKAQIQTNSLIPMRDEILAYIEDIQGAENLEISPDTPEIETPVHDPDEDEYKARPMIAADQIHVEDLI